MPATVTVERPRQREHGDYATNVALQLAKKARAPRRATSPSCWPTGCGAAGGIAAVDVAGPGFLNITVEAGAQGAVAAAGRRGRAAYGRTETLAGTRVNVEFISANPTGPLHLGHTRWAAVGDALARVLEAAGAEVAREFYVNDRGNQMDKFGASLEAAALGPAGARGRLPRRLRRRPRQAGRRRATRASSSCPRRSGWLPSGRPATRIQLGEQQAQLEVFRTQFDVWFSERALHEDGQGRARPRGAARQGHLYEADGALWMRTTDFGDDKDRVLVAATAS